MKELYTSHDAVALAELVERGEVQPRELLAAALEITAQRNPVINAVVVQDADRALAEVDAVASGPLSRGPSSRAPLRGVPFLLKDLYAEMTGLPLSNGSRLFADYVPDHDSVLVQRYRAAGLVIFGRTASPELGITTTTESELWGQTRNPWSLEHSAGGSSGGAAAAVAAGLVPAAHASDGGGSIRIPASCCGLFGLKPTRARVSMAPDRGEGWSGLSINHAITRSVRDSAALLDVVAGPVPGDPYFAPAPERRFLEEVKLESPPLRIALTTETFNGAPTDPECDAAARSAADLCTELGHRVEEARPTIPGEELADAARTIVAANLRATLEDRARALGRELAEDDVEPLTWATARIATERSLADYPRAVNTVHRVGRALADFFAEYDALLTPTLATPPPRLGELALTQPDGVSIVDRLKETIGFTQLMNAAGNPAMSVPLHWSASGLPIGAQFAAASGREALLLRLAGQLEAARPWCHRRPPEPE